MKVSYRILSNFNQICHDFKYDSNKYNKESPQPFHPRYVRHTLQPIMNPSKAPQKGDQLLSQYFTGNQVAGHAAAALRSI